MPKRSEKTRWVGLPEALLNRLRCENEVTVFERVVWDAAQQDLDPRSDIWSVHDAKAQAPTFQYGRHCDHTPTGAQREQLERLRRVGRRFYDDCRDGSAVLLERSRATNRERGGRGVWIPVRRDDWHGIGWSTFLGACRFDGGPTTGELRFMDPAESTFAWHEVRVDDALFADSGTGSRLQAVFECLLRHGVVRPGASAVISVDAACLKFDWVTSTGTGKRRKVQVAGGQAISWSQVTDRFTDAKKALGIPLGPGRRPPGPR